MNDESFKPNTGPGPGGNRPKGPGLDIGGRNGRRELTLQSHVQGDSVTQSDLSGNPEDEPSAVSRSTNRTNQSNAFPMRKKWSLPVAVGGLLVGIMAGIWLKRK